VEIWKEAERLVRSADVLMQRNIYDQAIVQCQEALRRDPAHIGALERLGKLYYAEGRYVEAVNALIRLLSVDPSRNDTKKRLIEALDACGDRDAVRYMAEWYLDESPFDAQVQRYLADVYYEEAEYANAVEAYERVLREAPKDREVLQLQANAYIQLEQFEEALVPLGKLQEIGYNDPVSGKQIAVCQAQLLREEEAVRTLGRMMQFFGPQVIMGWLKDPQFDPIREERVFQGFVERVGGEDFRMELEALARAEREQEQQVEAQLNVAAPDTPEKEEEALILEE
jgi:tetratricopeptide (TPR) repeat protein